MNKKFLYFQRGPETIGAYPVENLVAMFESGATAVKLFLKSRLGANADGVTANDTVELTVTSGKAKEVMQAIVEKINEVDGPRTDDFIVIADNTNQVYLTADITDVAETIGT